VPGALLLAPTRLAGANHQHVALFDVDLMVLLSGVEILRKNRLARLEPFDFPDLRNVEQDAAADDALARDRDRALAGALRADLVRVETVVHLALPEDVTE